MRDFNSYADEENNKKNADDKGENFYERVKKIAAQFDGKSKKDLLNAIFREAERGKKAGTLDNAQIDGFVKMLSPALDEKKRKYLQKVAEELKKI